MKSQLIVAPWLFKILYPVTSSINPTKNLTKTDSSGTMPSFETRDKRTVPAEKHSKQKTRRTSNAANMIIPYFLLIISL